MKWPIGHRVLKTGLAVTLSVWLIRLAGQPYEVFAAVSAVSAIAPSRRQSWRAASAALLANLLGAAIGTLALVAAGPHPLTIGAAVIVLIQLCLKLGLQAAVSSALVVSLFIMGPHRDPLLVYTLWRTAAIGIGFAVGLLVNRLVLPRNHEPDVYRALERAGLALDQFAAGLIPRLAKPETYRKPAIKADAAVVQKALDRARLERILWEESADLGESGAILDKAINTLNSNLERLQVIHRTALSVADSPLYQQRLPAIQAELATLAGYRRQIFSQLRPPVPQPALLAELSRLEQGPNPEEFATLVSAHPAEWEVLFRLYRIEYSLAHILGRLRSLLTLIQETNWAG